MNRRIKRIEDCIESAERKGLERSLGAVQLMLLGVGAVIGTGIFVLTAVGAERAGPGLLLSFVIAATVWRVRRARLCGAGGDGARGRAAPTPIPMS